MCAVVPFVPSASSTHRPSASSYRKVLASPRFALELLFALPSPREPPLAAPFDELNQDRTREKTLPDVDLVSSAPRADDTDGVGEAERCRDLFPKPSAS